MTAFLSNTTRKPLTGIESGIAIVRYEMSSELR